MDGGSSAFPAPWRACPPGYHRARAPGVEVYLLGAEGLKATEQEKIQGLGAVFKLVKADTGLGLAVFSQALEVSALSGGKLTVPQ